MRSPPPFRAAHRDIPIVEVDWPAPLAIGAVATTRQGGVSRGTFASLNLAGHVGDDPGAILTNRARLRERVGLPGEPVWLTQEHGVRSVDLDGSARPGPIANAPAADIAVTRRPGVVCAVLSADCVPILLCDRKGTTVGAVHAGWRGLASGVVAAGIAATGAPADRLLAWIGPCIGWRHYEVGAEVYERFAGILPPGGVFFRGPAHREGSDPHRRGHAELQRSGERKWLMDLSTVTRHLLHRAGVREVFGGRLCTASDPSRFFSYRRDGVTGRIASLIWIE